MKPIELYFFRHGIAAERGDPASAADEDRQLTEEGERKTYRAAEGLKLLQIGFDKILTSPWTRASQTADILSEVLEMNNPETLSQLAGDCSVAELLDGIAQQSGRRLLLVGHQPLLGETVAHLLCGSGKFEVDLKKSGVCAVAVDELPPQGPATLLWALTSKQLRLMSQSR